ncbi:MAG: hypothetical protein IPM79_26185 [Polyangiaceae bacterium]|nr:hypothetical protein [Polyangiaceae bacterium]
MQDVDQRALEDLRVRVAQWRSRYGGRGRRLPDWVWSEAGMLAGRVGVGEVSQVLKLRGERLERFAEATRPGELAVAARPPTFVELGSREVVAAGVVAEIELRGAVRARVRGSDAESVARVLCRLIDEDRRCSS